MAQAQQNQQNGHRVNGVEDGNGDFQDGGQAQVADEKRPGGDAVDPLPVAEEPEQGRKILRNGVDEPHAGGQAGQGKDGRQQHGAGRTEQLIDDAPEGPGAVFLDRIDPGGTHSHIAQGQVYQRQDASGQQSRPDRMAQLVPLFGKAEIGQCSGDDQTEIQGGDGVHGLIALRKAPEQGGRSVRTLRSGEGPLSPEQEADKEKQQQEQQGRGQEIADALHQFPRIQAQPQGCQEKYQGIEQQKEPHVGRLRQIGGYGHFKRHGGGSGDAQARPDGEVNEQGEHQGESFAHMARQLVQPVEPGHHDDPQHRQKDRRDEKADHGRRGGSSRILTQKGREDQVPRSEEQGKEHEAHGLHIAPGQFHKIAS